MDRSRIFRRLAGAGTLLALCVVVFGAFVRLSDAGLGCPDWPGCYGQLGAPSTEAHIAAAQEGFPHAPVDTAKAWIEMGHRYIAGILGLLILGLAVLAWRGRRDGLPMGASTARSPHSSSTTRPPGPTRKKRGNTAQAATPAATPVI
ncbi:COX15/CtaA family protein, partial [Algiphilus sp.]|uniref:COX15/CtaA family protein n=1 Tax=Algiphilus sp. TaxID=1872431 RepID=UPI003C66FA0C